MKKKVSVRMISAIIILSMVTTWTWAQKVTITGQITEMDGEPVIGASVVVKGTARGTVSDFDGNYSIKADLGEILVFSYVGFKTQEMEIKSTRLNITLQPATIMLDESVVIGYVRQVKRDIVGSVATVSSTKVSKPKKSKTKEKVVGIQPAAMVASAPAIYTNTDEYHGFAENRFHAVQKDPLSTFSIDVDVAAYGQMRRHINQGQLPPVDAVRIEEMINYFSYQYDQPTGNDPVALSAEAGVCPWNPDHRLVKIGVKAREIAKEDLPASNFVFLIDVSGSMWGPTRLDLVKSSLKLLVNNLRDEDRVAIVVYASRTGELLPSTSGKDKQKIREVIDGLEANGSTAGGQAIQKAYEIAEKNFIKGGNNRIILCTDGDFNVGVSTREGLQELIEQKRKTGVYLTVLGYGMGNYKDNLMQVLAEKGNGNYAYIENLQEANKVLVTEFGGTLFTVAKDVKLQVEFNPTHVQGYRLVGYESRMLEDEDFNDDTKDAGEMGAGHTVTALYEVIPAGVKTSWLGGDVDPLKYRKNKQKKEKVQLDPTDFSRELLTVKLRYKQSDKDVSKKIEYVLNYTRNVENSADFIFASAVAMYGQLLKDSQFKGNVSYTDVIELAKKGVDPDDLGYRREFIRLVDAAGQLAKK